MAAAAGAAAASRQACEARRQTGRQGRQAGMRGRQVVGRLACEARCQTCSCSPGSPQRWAAVCQQSSGRPLRLHPPSGPCSPGEGQARASGKHPQQSLTNGSQLISRMRCPQPASWPHSHPSRPLHSPPIPTHLDDFPKHAASCTSNPTTHTLRPPTWSPQPVSWPRGCGCGQSPSWLGQQPPWPPPAAWPPAGPGDKDSGGTRRAA